MLREITNKHIKPRISPFKVTTTASGVTVNSGYGDFTATRAGAGQVVLTDRQGYSRSALVFLTQGTSDGYYAAYQSATTNTKDFPIRLFVQNGTAAEGILEGFTFGWDSSDLGLTKVQRVAATNNAPRIIWTKISSSGVPQINASDFSATAASGVYNITYKKAFARTPIVMANSIDSTSSVGISAKITNSTAAGCTITMSPESTTPGACQFYFCAIGSDAQSDSAKGRMPIQTSQRKTRILAAQVTMASGVPSITVGAETGGADFSGIVDNGAGDFSLTFATPFAREPAVFVTTSNQRSQLSTAATTAGCRVLIKAANGDNTDVDGVTNIFIIGSDDATQY
jgi:hypothetical protein